MNSSKNEDRDLKTFTGWKLDVQRAVRADKKVGLAAASAFAAFMDYVNQDTRMAWPSETALATVTGSSTKTIRKHMNRLVEANWLEPVGKGPKGTIKYRVTDHRMNTVLDQMAKELDRHREKQRERQAKMRRKTIENCVRRDRSDQSNQPHAANVTVYGSRPIRPLSQYTGSGLSQYRGTDEHLQSTPSEGSYEGREEYRRATNGE